MDDGHHYYMQLHAFAQLQIWVQRTNPMKNTPITPNHAQRPKLAQDYAAILGIDPSFTEANTACLDLQAYCDKHDLEFTPDQQDAFISHNASGRFIVFARTSGLVRMALASGRYLPGKERIYKTGPGRQDHFAEVSCWTRQAVTDVQWVEVSRTICLADYHDREVTSPYTQNPEIMGEWAIAPNHKLMEVARAITALSALGSYLARHNFFYAPPRSLVHHAYSSGRLLA